jgi:TetR/AcrR family transcriptional repressor of nem operon
LDGLSLSRRVNLEARKRILAAAHGLFYKNGFRGTSMDDVASASGVTKANLFHYYPTKETLGLAVFEYAAADMKDKLEEQFARSRDPIRGVARMFDEAAGRLRRNGCSGGCFFGNLAQELSDHNEPIRVRLAEHLRFWAGELAASLDRARAAGYFRRGFRSEVAAEAILSLFEGALLYSKVSRKPRAVLSAKRLATRYLETCRA